MTNERISWTTVEETVGIEALPHLHRAFLAERGVADPASMPLRRVQQAVERELNRLVSAGQAERTPEGILLDRALVADLPAKGGSTVGELLSRGA
jgi:hypothetical protein